MLQCSAKGSRHLAGRCPEQVMAAFCTIISTAFVYKLTFIEAAGVRTMQAGPSSACRPSEAGISPRKRGGQARLRALSREAKKSPEEWKSFLLLPEVRRGKDRKSGDKTPQLPAKSPMLPQRRERTAAQGRIVMILAWHAYSPKRLRQEPPPKTAFRRVDADLLVCSCCRRVR